LHVHEQNRKGGCGVSIWGFGDVTKGLYNTKTDGFGAFLGKVSFTTKFVEELAVRMCGSAAGPQYEALTTELVVMLKHLSLVTIGVAEGLVTFATCTHSPEIKGKYISGFTQLTSLADFKLDSNLQYVSGTTLTLPLDLFIDALNKSAIVLNEVDPAIKIAEWAKDAVANQMLQNTMEQNWIAQNMIETQNKLLREAGINSIELELPKTYMTRFDGESGEFKVNQYSSVNLIKGFKATAKFLPKV
jgi:hypothetical protein